MELQRWRRLKLFQWSSLFLYFVHNNWVEGVYGRILTDVVTKVRTQWLTQLVHSDRNESGPVTSWPRSEIPVRRCSAALALTTAKYQNCGQNLWASLSIIPFSIPYLVKFSPVEGWLSSLPLDLSCCGSVECKYYVMVMYWSNVLSTSFFTAISRAYQMF